MRPLVIDQTAKENIERVVKYAYDHKISIEVMREIASGEVAAAGFSPNYTCEIFFGYRIVFSVEQHPMGWCKHISVSVPNGLLPSIEAMRLLIKEFGFKSTLENCLVRIEEIPEDAERPRAVEVIEPIIV